MSERETLAYCEPVWASTRSHEHIRRVLGDIKLGGGIDGVALCGFDVNRGWDLRREVAPVDFPRLMAAECNPLCSICADLATLAALSAHLAPARDGDTSGEDGL